jgi:hypothetical protein
MGGDSGNQGEGRGIEDKKGSLWERPINSAIGSSKDMISAWSGGRLKSVNVGGTIRGTAGVLIISRGEQEIKEMPKHLMLKIVPIADQCWRQTIGIAISSRSISALSMLAIGNQEFLIVM